MALFKSSNPALRSSTFEKQSSFIDTSNSMTVEGTVGKIAILSLLVFCTAIFSWNRFMEAESFEGFRGYLIGGSIGGLVTALIVIFNPKSSPYLAPLYALLEGLVLGALSAMFEYNSPGIAVQAILLTFGVLFGMLFAYRSGLIKVNQQFRSMVISATFGIAIIYLISFVGSFFGFPIPMIHEASTFGIIFSLVVVAIAALNLVLDFDFIENSAEQGAPKYMEWYGAFGLMVTLIWLYLEILRLLSKLRER